MNSHIPPSKDVAAPPRLTRFDAFPEALLEAPTGALWQHLPGPSLFFIPGRSEPPLFVSVLLHGNEDTGWRAIQTVLKRHHKSALPRAMLLFVGNIEAARANVRTLPDQEDYNRVWPGTARPDTPTAALMREVVDIARRSAPFASIDIHNNTGLNPHYGCVNRLDAAWLHLATLYSRTVVYFTQPHGVQSAAFAELCPAVTLECGKPGSGIEHAAAYVEACLHLAEFPAHPIRAQDIDLFHTIATVKVPDDVSFSFGGTEGDIEFPPDLDHLNFRELPAGAEFARLHGQRAPCLQAHADDGSDIGHTVFACSNGRIRLTRPLMPAMLTLDANIIRQDCLCYLMERLPLPPTSKAPA